MVPREGLWADADAAQPVPAGCRRRPMMVTLIVGGDAPLLSAPEIDRVALLSSTGSSRVRVCAV